MTEVGPGVYPNDDDIPAQGVPAAARVRPRQATVASILLIIFGALAVVVTLFLLSVLNDATDHGETVPTISYALVYLQFIASGAQIVSGAFVLAGQWWARLLAIALCGLNVLGGVVNLFSGAVLPALIGIAINVVLIKYLTNEDVREWCESPARR